MGRDKTVMPNTIPRYGRRDTPCPFHRECEATNKGRGIGYCDFDGNQTICDGDIRFCDKPDALRDYLLINRPEREAEKWMQATVQGAYETRGNTEISRVAESRKNCLRVLTALPLEYEQGNRSCPQAGVSVFLSEKGLILHSIFRDLRISQMITVRLFFPNGYKFDSFQAIATVTSKEAHAEKDWRGVKYGLKFIYISQADQERLELLLYGETTDHRFDGESVSGWSVFA